jgi:phosphoglucosamine mutase
MSRKYFGTDGVRGTVGSDPMTADFAMRLASAAAQVLVPRGGTVVIGKDTRLSGYMFESALEAGFVAAGADVLLVGPLPTPGIARLTQEFDADLGVVISASHNRFFDNGIKFFDGGGSKLSDDVERDIEARLSVPAITLDSQALGKATRIDTARVRYQDFCAASMPEGVDLQGLKIVFDGANGAGYKVGPRTLSALGAVQLTVPAVKADVGVALDGDGDRVLMVDEQGRLVDGDQLLFVLATARKAKGGLQGPVVGTVMSNLGLEHALKAQDIEFRRAAVGDRYVLEMLRDGQGVLGGETSGHLLVLDKTTTGDGLISALQVLAVMKEAGTPLSALVDAMPRYPQTMVNVRMDRRLDPADSPEIRDAVAAAETELADKGRVVLRASGTEPVIRVMVEGENEAQVVALAERLASVVAEAAA